MNHTRVKTELLRVEIKAPDVRRLLIKGAMDEIGQVGISLDPGFEPQVQSDGYSGFIVLLKEKEK